MNEAGRERETLFPSTEKVAGELFFPFGKSELLDAFTHSLPPILHAVHARDKIEVFLNAQILPKTESLRHVTDFAFKRLAPVDHGVTQDFAASVVRAEQSAKHSQERGLTTAVRAEEPVDFAGAHG